MKRVLTILLIMLIALPAFLQVMPHGIDHALHQSKTHHAQNHHGHDHDEHHGHKVHDKDHHAINLDIVTFYDEYLHADLQAPDQITLSAPEHDTQDIKFDIAVNIAPTSRYELSPLQSRAPPDWQSFRAEKTPLYLSTLRLRI